MLALFDLLSGKTMLFFYFNTVVCVLFVFVCLFFPVSSLGLPASGSVLSSECVWGSTVSFCPRHTPSLARLLSLQVTDMLWSARLQSPPPLLARLALQAPRLLGSNDL